MFVFVFHDEMVRLPDNVLEVNLGQSSLVENNIILFISSVHFYRCLWNIIICYPEE